jgi:hypothetical protein
LPQHLTPLVSTPEKSSLLARDLVFLSPVPELVALVGVVPTVLLKIG